MTSDSLHPAQAHKLKATVGRQLRYLNRLCDRMQRLGFPPSDQLWQSATRARNEVQGLYVAAHYASCASGVGKQATLDVTAARRSSAPSITYLCAACGKPFMMSPDRSCGVEQWLLDHRKVCGDAVLLPLDGETETALKNGEINKQVALRLANEPDVTRPVQLLTKAREIAAKRLAELQRRVEREEACRTATIT